MVLKVLLATSLFAGLSASSQSASGQAFPVHVESMEWIYRELYSDSGLSSCISGVLVNESNRTLSNVLIQFNLYSFDGEVVGNTISFLSVLAPSDRWRFAASVPIDSLSMHPVYAKVASIQIGADALATPDSPQAWDPAELQRRAEAKAMMRRTEAKYEAKRLKAEEKARKKAAKQSKEAQQCP